MKIVRAIDDVPATISFPVVTIGNFDGVHLGHRRLIEQMKEVARTEGGTSVVVTFRPHPGAVLHPEKAAPMICTWEERHELLEATGLDLLLELPFDRAFSELSAERFVEVILVDGLRTRWFVAGPDSRFGNDRAGDAELLSRIGERAGFGVESVTPLLVGGERVSSSRIRRLVAEEGDVATAGALLGRPPRLRGEVVSGDRRGRTLGFPTANLRPSSELIPRRGVYATRAHLPDGRAFDSVTNIGIRPTFGEPGLRIEAHLLDFDGDLYGSAMALDLVERIRDEQKFDGAGALVRQIEADVERGRELLR